MKRSVVTRVAVLLATFNGERYLAQQLRSILEQSHKNLLILIRDDGSNDGTTAVIDEFVANYPERIFQVTDGQTCLGPGVSFTRLLEYALDHKVRLEIDQAYLCFADQDDVWEAEKVELEVAALQQIDDHGRVPALVHTDLAVVDEALQPIAESLAQYQGLRPGQANFGRALVANAITGCTMMINQSLAGLAVPIPGQAVMHDWWLGLVAASQGKIAYLDRSLVRYRQHADNTLGAKPAAIGPRDSRQLITRLFDASSQQVFEAVADQSRVFLDRYQHQLGLRQRCLCRLAMLLRPGLPPWQKALYRLIRRL